MKVKECRRLEVSCQRLLSTGELKYCVRLGNQIQYPIGPARTVAVFEGHWACEEAVVYFISSVVITVQCKMTMTLDFLVVPG